MAGKIDTKYFHIHSKVGAIGREEKGFSAELGQEFIKVEVLRPDLLKLQLSRNGSFDENPTFAVSADLQNVSADFTLSEEAEMLTLTTSALVFTLWKEPFRLEARRLDGSLIFQSAKPDKAGQHWTFGTLNDEFILARQCQMEDAFFGLGEKTGRFNRKGRNFTLWNTDVLNPNATGEFTAERAKEDPRSDATSTEFDPYYMSIPFFYHQPAGGTAMAGFFIDNAYRSRFEFEEAGEFRIHLLGGQYTEYLFSGPTMREILRAYTWLTGRMQAPPIWALGHHQCRWKAYTQETFLALAHQHRESEIPCDTLWLDIDYMDEYRVFTWNRKTFPDPQGMLATLRKQGFRVITIIDPGVKFDPGYAIFDEALERDLLCRTDGGAIYLGQVWPGRTAFPDFALPEARAWWGEKNAEHVRFGLSGIWNDMNEPATGDIPPDAMRFQRGAASHQRYHNQYALLMAMGTVEGISKASPEERTFVLSRAGSAGIQRYAANWMGDNFSRWDHLWMSLPMALGIGISGQAFVGADIGGFAGDSNGELLVRWTQCASLTPFCRNHNCAGNRDQYSWSFGPVVEELGRESLKLRYRLMPYIYSAFMKSVETGEPVQKPLLFDFQDDPTTAEIDDQYLFGDHLLVAPVYKEGCTARQVYLPEGTWHHWHTGECFEGKRFIIAAAPMEYIPLYALGGSVIPLWPEAPQTTMGHAPEVVDLLVFVPGKDGTTDSWLHEDDGLTFQFQNGACLQTRFAVERSGDLLTLRAETTGNGFPEFRRRAFRIHFRGGTLLRAILNGGSLKQTEPGIFTVEGTESFVLQGGLAFSK